VIESWGELPPHLVAAPLEWIARTSVWPAGAREARSPLSRRFARSGRDRAPSHGSRSMWNAVRSRSGSRRPAIGSMPHRLEVRHPSDRRGTRACVRFARKLIPIVSETQSCVAKTKLRNCSRKSAARAIPSEPDSHNSRNSRLPGPARARHCGSLPEIRQMAHSPRNTIPRIPENASCPATLRSTKTAQSFPKLAPERFTHSEGALPKCEKFLPNPGAKPCKASRKGLPAHHLRLVRLEPIAVGSASDAPTAQISPTAI
jgi:hypothetical protein